MRNPYDFRRRRPIVRALLVTAIGLAIAPPAQAQLPGLPTLQGAFPAPGVAVGVNGGRLDGRTIGALAAGYGQGSGRLGVAAGVGMTSAAASGYRGSRVAYGARAALTARRFAEQRIAVTPFAGFGSTRSTVADAARAGGTVQASDVGKVIQRDLIPLGVAAGWRAALGTRAVAVSVSPMYALSRQTGGSSDASAWHARVAAVVEAAISSRIGVTLGTELGQTAAADEPGPRGASIGAGMSVLLRR